MEHPLLDMLAVTVPIRCKELHGATPGQLEALAAEAVGLVAAQGDQVQWGGRDADAACRALTTGIAAAALAAWGGITVAGRHWCQTPGCADPEADHAKPFPWLVERELPETSATDGMCQPTAPGDNSRKTTASYYTPAVLVECLLDTTLNPVIDGAIKRGSERGSSNAIADELLALTVCDPSCGSGHFLIASARRIAKRLASVRERKADPDRAAVRQALRDVVARCIYGVDLNPMAVELSKVSLWLVSLEHGKPCQFLDAHIKCGNALMGATPALMANGIPDEAFKPIEGDDKKVAAAFRKQNRAERNAERAASTPATDALF